LALRASQISNLRFQRDSEDVGLKPAAKFPSVIPAHAGIQVSISVEARMNLDSRLHGNDDIDPEYLRFEIEI